MTDLVSRLRKHQKIETALGEKTVSGKPWTLAGEAADEIERLASENKELSERQAKLYREGAVEDAATIEHLTSENKLQWENIQKLLAEIERLTRERGGK